MNTELEKILEEIDEEILLKKVVWDSIEKPPYNDFEQSLWIAGMRNAKEIIRKYMNDGWIPVEERLPDKEGAYLVTYQRDKKQCEEFDLPKIDVHSDYFRGGIWFNNCFSGGRNIAWRPLPEPYRPERSEV